ncbi:MAG: hypothetical protein CMC88_03960 [Flavobacteriaceae bacterium]|nr:hypothetical protein [Flavobacteriaceae bacterium]
MGAHDRIGPQWLAISIINPIIFLYLIYLKKSILFINRLFSNKGVLFYSFFLIFSFISIIKSENLPESIITFSNYFSIFFCLLNLIILNGLLINPKKFFVELILMIFLAEVWLSFYPMLKDISSFGGVIARSKNYIGASANVNVTSFSLVFKLPLVLYYLQTRKKFLSKFLVLLLILISLFVIIILNSRGAFLGILVVFLLYFFSIFYLKKDQALKLKLLNSSLIIIAFVFSVLLSNLSLNSRPENNKKNANYTFYDRASTISLSTKDGSVDQRLRFYKHALNSISKNIFFGIGIGNWKLVSIKYDRENIQQYIIPYHAHNDFLQIGSESGVLAMISYILVFIFIVLMLYNLYLKEKDKIFSILIFSSIIIYLLDASLNFPIARPISQLSLILFFALIINLNQLNKIHLTNFKIPQNIILIFLLFSSPLAIYSSYKNFISLKDQYILFSDYNGDTKILTTKNIHLAQETFPSLTATVLPINELKANYFIQEGKHQKAIELLGKKNLNPYSGFRENLMVQAYKGLKIDDSVYKYIRTAFYKLPSNASHSTQYFNELRKRKDLKEIDNAFSIINIKLPLVWKAYLNAKSEVYGPGNQEMKKTVDSLIKVYPNDQDFKELSKFINIGKFKFAKSIEASIIGEDNFNQKRFSLAIENYLEAIKFDPSEYSFYESIAICYQQIGDTYNAYKYFDIVIDSLNPRTGKSEFYKGVNLVKDKNYKKGCSLLKKSMSYGFSGAKNVLDQFCN